ncbi:MAG: uvrB, partial [Burkholderiaceae bacterium]|nr:uvrB [Burkholderiaceae bacterium]
AMTEKQVSKEIKRLEKAMHEHAQNLEFEQAAKVRDELKRLKEMLFGAALPDSVTALWKKS